MAEQQPRDALVAHVVERLGAAVGGDDVAIIATVLRDVPALASSVKLTVSARMQQHNTFLSCLNCTFEYALRQLTAHTASLQLPILALWPWAALVFAKSSMATGPRYCTAVAPLSKVPTMWPG